MRTDQTKLLRQLKSAWNNLDTRHIESYLSEDVVYESQWVLISIRGKPEVLKFLEGKFQTIKNIENGFFMINAAIGYIPSMDMRPCILLSQIYTDELTLVTVLIEVKNSLISRIDLCFIPSPEEIIIGIRGRNKNNS